MENQDWQIYSPGQGSIGPGVSFYFYDTGIVNVTVEYICRPWPGNLLHTKCSVYNFDTAINGYNIYNFSDNDCTFGLPTVDTGDTSHRFLCFFNFFVCFCFQKKKINKVK